jgi:manganese-dependent inorganic pyrophosphatase
MFRTGLIVIAYLLAMHAERKASKVFVVGHINPDTDSVAAAISVAHLYQHWKGIRATPCVQGQVSLEAAFALDRFKINTPELLKDAKGSRVILVDHSDREQAPENIDQEFLVGIFDHHKLGGLSTNAPPEIWIRPVGSTCTVVKELYDFARQAIPPDIAGLMLCAILSDTLMFHSPTTTPDDRLAAESLAQLAGIPDISTLGAELLSAKCSIANLPPKEIILQDYKDFNMTGNIIGIGQIELLDANILTSKFHALLAACHEMLLASNRHSIIFVVTDVARSGSTILVASRDAVVIEKALGVQFDQGSAWLDGVVSRKKQIVPVLEKAFAEKH